MAAQSPQISREESTTVVSPKKSVTLRISHYNPKTDSGAKFVDYTIPYEKWTTVLDAILEVKKHLDHSIGVRYSCRQASCGSCGMKINGRPRLACFTKIIELNSDVITIEPMDNFPITRDLVVGFERMFSTHKKLKPYIINPESEISPGTKEFLQSPEDVEKYIQFANCIKCGLCNSACPTMATDSSFIGPQALAQAYRYVADTRDK
jgi:succinate dehydrogenase / fumarate reductase iron-sulfur subunit